MTLAGYVGEAVLVSLVPLLIPAVIVRLVSRVIQ